MQERIHNINFFKINVILKKTGNNFKIFLCFLIFSNLFLSVPGYSQSDSLYKYLEIAAINNPSIQHKFSEYQAALQKVPQVGSLTDPELSFGIFLKPMEIISGNQVADIRLMQMFPWFGVLKNAKDEMSLMANAKFELFRDAKLQVFYDVQRTWYELYKIKKNINISEKNIEILKIIERLALTRFKSAASVSAGSSSYSTPMTSGSSQTGIKGSLGMQAMGAGQGNYGSSVDNQPSESEQNASMGSSSGSQGLVDLYRIQIETLELENNIALLKNQEQSLIALFNSYMNRSPATPVFISETLTVDTLEIPLIIVPDSILAKNPMLSMIEFEKQSVEARKKMVTAMGYPMVGFGLDYSLISKNAMSASSMNGKDMVMPMVTVTLPVYRKKYNAMIKEADLLKSVSSQNYLETANSLQTEYFQAVQLYKDAQRRVKLYGNQSQLASKSLDLIIKSYSASSSQLTDVLRIRQQALDYELKQVESVADFNTAVALLKRLGNL